MAESLPAATVASAGSPPRFVLWDWVRRRLGTTTTFIRRRPGRSLVLFGLGILAIGAITALGVWIWFGYHLRAARQELDRGHNAAALQHLQMCRQVRPNHPEVLLLACRVARRNGLLDQAEACLDYYWELNGDDERLVFERLLLRATRGEMESTLTILLARIRQGGPEARLAREALVTGLTSAFRWGEAITILEGWLKEFPDDTIALMLKGKLQQQREQVEPAVATFRRVLELDPEYDEARLRLCGLLLENRQGEESLAHLTYLRGRMPENLEVQVQLARALALQGQTQQARAVLEDCLRKDPDFPSALAEQGRMAYAAGDDETADACFQRVLQANPGDLSIRSQYVLVLTRRGKHAEAAAQEKLHRQLSGDFTRISELIAGPLQKHPNDPAIRHEIAMITLRAGLPAEALRWFDRTLEVDPNHLPTHQMLAAFYRETGNPVLAAKHRAIAQQLTAQKR